MSRQTTVSAVYHICQLAYTEDFDFHNFSSPSFLMQKMTELREPLQSNSSLVFTLSSPDSFCVLFDITSETICRTEMACAKQTQKMIPFVMCEMSIG